jgi:hypothetical protein
MILMHQFSRVSPGTRRRHHAASKLPIRQW